jgi:C2H2 type zinc finger protein
MNIKQFHSDNNDLDKQHSYITDITNINKQCDHIRHNSNNIKDSFIYTNIRYYYCDRCLKIIKNSERLFRHKNNLTQCIKAQKEFDINNISHIKEILNDNNIIVHICNKCNFVFKDISALRRHQNLRKNDCSKKYICEDCKLECSTQGRLDSHKKSKMACINNQKRLPII